jgi:hypothetical protein
LTVDTDRAGRGLAPRFRPNLNSQRRNQSGPRAIISPLGKVVVDSTLSPSYAIGLR